MKSTRLGEAGEDLGEGITKDTFRWVAMEKNVKWSNLRRSLLIRTENCRVSHRRPQLICPIPDEDPNMEEYFNNELNYIQDSNDELR